MSFLEDKLNEAIREYNRYHAPEVVAELVQVSENWFKVAFVGSFLYCSCGVYDYLDDLRVLLEDFGLKTYIESFERSDEETIIALFVVEKSKR